VLRGRELQEAEQWLTDAEEHGAPQPTLLQTRFVIAKSNHRRLAQKHTGCYIKGCEITQSISEDLLCQE